MHKLAVDLDLVRKYNVPGPRYTSYPPATRFSDEVSWPKLAEEILRNNETAKDLSLYFHIPFCRSQCWYCGCTTVITRQQGQSASYVDYLAKEMAQMTVLMHRQRRVVQLHLGGGTPTFLLPDEIRRLGDMIRSRFDLAEDLEGSVEIDPRRLTREHLKALREAGFNRVSLGVQDFDPRVQLAVHRIQPKQLTDQAVSWIREAGFKLLNIDLIYGLPFQTADSFDRTLDEVQKLAPDRLAVFSYAHVPWVKPAQKILEKHTLPSGEVKLQLLKRVIEKLTGHGEYVYIGMDHFARPTDELARAQRHGTLQRNFQGYSTRGDADIYAFGMSSISRTQNVYWQNKKELTDYYAALQDGTAPIAKAYFLTEDDKVRREVIMQIMCNLELNFSDMSRRLGCNFTERFAAELNSLEDLEADGLITRHEGSVRVTDVGRLFIRNIAMRFDACLPHDNEQRFSKTI
jgi:oxygen-independent coproporphyrinogen III oxidase